MKTWIKASLKVLNLAIVVICVFCWFYALSYLDYFNNPLAVVIGTLAALAFAVYMFRKLEGWTWFQHKTRRTI